MPSRPERRLLNNLPYVLFVLIVILFATSRFSLFDFPLDDAWIHRVYSQSFAHGNGFEYNPGQREAGSSSPLWSIVTAPAHWFGFLGTDVVVVWVKLIGVALSLASIRAVREIGGSVGSKTTGLVAASLFALDPRLAFSALSGMESSLLVALWLWAAYALLAKRPWPACLLMSLAPAARPETLVVLPFFLLAFVAAALNNRWTWQRCMPLALLPVPMLLWGLFCRATNGHWFPTTLYMKARVFRFGAEQMRNALQSIDFRGPFPALVALLSILFALAFLLIRRRTKGAPLSALLVFGPAAYILGVVYTRMFILDGYYVARWVEPPALLLSAAACLGLTLSWEKARDLFPGIAATTSVSRAAVAILLVLSLPHFIDSLAEQRFHLIHDSRATHMINVRAGEWVRDHTETDAVVAVNDAGAIRFFGQRRTLDLIGLNNAEIAFSGNRNAAVAEADWVAIFPSWFAGARFLETLEPVKVISIPPEEYTISERPTEQSTLVIYRHKAG